MKWVAAGGHTKYTDQEAIDAIEGEDPLDLAGVLNLAKHLSFIEIATPANPSQNALKLFARANGDSIELVARSSEGQESILATLLDSTPAAANKFLLLGVKQ